MNKKTIGFDLTFISLKEIKRNRLTSSIAVFVCDLLDGLNDAGYSEYFTLLVHPCAKELFSKRFPDYKICVVGKILPKIINRFGLFDIIRLYKKYGVYSTILKFQGINRVFYPIVIPQHVDNNIEYIGIVHDLMTIDEFNKKDDYQKSFSKSKHLVAISNYTKGLIINKYKISQDKITTIPNSLYYSTNKMKTAPIEELKGKSYILDCNAITERKNTHVIISAFALIKDEIEDDLVLCGGYKEKNYCSYIEKLISVNGLQDRVHIYLEIEEEKKNWLFMNCHLFVSPSENEGFGRTPIEAALCLKPVITTKATALKETTYGLLHYVENPRDQLELANKIMEVLGNIDDIKDLEKIKEIFTKMYSPSRISNMYINLLKNINWL